MLVPSYRRMVKRFVSWANGDPGARVLAIGPWAKRDFLRMGVRADKLVDWGYFVAPSTASRKAPPQEPPQDSLRELAPPSLGLSDSSSTSQTTRTLRVLWVGRELGWKRVKDIERAVEMVNKGVGSKGVGSRGVGSREWGVDSWRPIEFTKLTGVGLAEVRKAMREHDVYVLASDENEGWGAALNEALEEGMSAIGTFEAGASAAMLPRERLYHAGDVRALARLLEREWEQLYSLHPTPYSLPPCSIGEWTAKMAAGRLVRRLYG